MTSISSPVSPSNTPSNTTPEILFDSFNIPEVLRRAVKDLGYTKATPIQAMALPPALLGRDVLGTAQTGSGKTAAFLLPILTHLLTRSLGTTRALVIAPTRELAAQIEESAAGLMKYTKLRVASVFGGVGMNPQQKAFRTGVELIVATPGRLLDHFQHSYATMQNLEILVLDEADRMLDMGFLPDIRRVLRHIPKNRQTLFFSATMPAAIGTLSTELLHNPVSVGAQRKAAPASGITQSIYPVSEDLKTGLLLELLEQGMIAEAIVFTRTKHRANRVAERLIKAGISAERIHGNRSQSARTEALAGFKSGKYRILVATDIAARGIDIEALGHVVNFDVPNVPEDYIHRVGRTARAEQTGEAITFCSPSEEGDLKDIEKAVGKSLPKSFLESFDYRAKPAAQLEVPLKERIKAIQERKSADRARSKAKAAGQGGQGGTGSSSQGQGQGSGQGSSQGSSQGQRSSQGNRQGQQGQSRAVSTIAPERSSHGNSQGSDNRNNGGNGGQPPSTAGRRSNPSSGGRR